MATTECPECGTRRSAQSLRCPRCITPTTKGRVRSAQRALRTMEADSGSDPKTRIIDLLADLMHYCHAKGLCWETCLRCAENHYESEQGK
jgi:hypothetical protein